MSAFKFLFRKTSQKPIGSGFGAASTASDVVEGLNLSGKVAIVTGGYSRIGLETARVLASDIKVIWRCDPSGWLDASWRDALCS